VPSPVDPSRRTALVRALNQAEMYFTAHKVSTGQVTDLGLVDQRLAEEFLQRDDDAWWNDHAEPLVKAIEAGKYGPYQESE
jgi:hypothetical protein